MSDPMSAGEGGVLGAMIGAIITWFANVIYMRDKFISTKQCGDCKTSSAVTESLKVQALEGRMVAVELCVGDLYKQSKDNHGLICEIHGMLKARGKLEIL